MRRIARTLQWLMVSGAIAHAGCTGSPVIQPTKTSTAEGEAAELAVDVSEGVQSAASNVVKESLGNRPTGGASADTGELPGLDNPLVQAHLAPDVEIEGQWESFRTFWGSRILTIKRDADPPVRFHLHFVQSLDLGDSEYERTATFENGVLTLNEEMWEFAMRCSRSPYTVIYVLRTENGDFLLPSVNAELMKSLDELGDFFSYSRRKPGT